MRVTPDTNVLARTLVDDSGALAQCIAAREALGAASEIFVPQVVQIELCWVLASAFGLRHAEILTVLKVLVVNPRVELDQRDKFEATLERFAANPASTFADCLIVTVAEQRESALLTFDKKLARQAGVTVLAGIAQR